MIGVDGAPSMIEHARENARGVRRAGRAAASATCSSSSSTEQVDAIFSNATFHWILDHERLFARLFAALRPGGVLEAQCGGEGNVAEWKRAVEAAEGDERFAAYLRGMPATVQLRLGRRHRGAARARRVRGRAGLARAQGRRAARAARVRARGRPRQAPRARCPSELHDEFVDAVLGSMPRPLVLEYVRLNISARRPA